MMAFMGTALIIWGPSCALSVMQDVFKYGMNV